MIRHDSELTSGYELFINGSNNIDQHDSVKLVRDHCDETRLLYFSSSMQDRIKFSVTF